MNVMHILATANTGGIESLCKDYALYSSNRNVFVVLWGKNGITAKEIRQNGGVVIELEALPKDVLPVFYKLCKIVRCYSIETVVVHHASPIMHFYMQLLKVCYHNIKTVAYAHGAAEDMCRQNDLNGLRIRKEILKRSLKKSTRIVAISDAVKKSLVDYFGISENCIDVIYNGTDTSRFISTLANGFHNPIKLIYVGRLIQEKGVQSILEVLSRLPKEQNWILDVVGDGEFRKELEVLTKKLSLENHVNFLGNCSNIPELLNQHDVFIHMPEWDEGFGITIVEAMAAGLLCICAAKGGIPEIITDRQDGILVHSKQELFEVLSNLLAEPNMCRIYRLRENAMVRAQDFDIKQFSKRLDSTICNLK